MKYSVNIEIDLPISIVHELFDNPDNMHKWQPSLKAFEIIEGEPGKVGSKSRLHYKMGKRNLEMIETITKNNLPNELTATYETKGVYNVISNKFEALSENSTQWVSENEFKFSGFMSIMSLFMRSAFPRETQKFMKQFKEFAETQNQTIDAT